jgi:hypothetical protein
MTEKDERDLKRRKFYRAEQEAAFSDKASPDTPQTRDPAYKLAFRDVDFLLREELRPVRFQLELLKPEMLLDEAGVGSTLVMYGSARIPSPDAVEALLENASDENQAVAKRLAEKAKYYDEAYRRRRWSVNGLSSKTASASSLSARAAVPRSWRPPTRAPATPGRNRSGSTSSCPTNRRPTST